MSEAEMRLWFAKIMAEVLRVQRWAGGDSVNASRIFGLQHGFETTMNAEVTDGISEEIQAKVEDVLSDVDAGQQSTEGLSIKARLRKEEVDESVAHLVMKQCVLEGRFQSEVKKVTQFRPDRLPEQNWYGALHYMELVDTTHGDRAKLHAVFAPTVPRIGEFVVPEGGSTMEVVGVEYVAATLGKDEGRPYSYLIPYVLLKIANNEESE